jgi:hypothetical protein
LEHDCVYPPKRSSLLLVALLLPGCGDDPVGPPNGPDTIDNEAELIQALASAYRSLDVQLLESLFADDADSRALYSFTRRQGDSVEVLWNVDDELKIHARMFEPEKIAPPDPPLQEHLWIERIEITLTQLESFKEREDLYQSESNPNGLDPERWTATEAGYRTDVTIAARSTFFRIEDESARFLVIQDLAKASGDAGRFLILGWEEECSSTGEACWSVVKRLYE